MFFQKIIQIINFKIDQIFKVIVTIKNLIVLEKNLKFNLQLKDRKLQLT